MGKEKSGVLFSVLLSVWYLLFFFSPRRM